MKIKILYGLEAVGGGALKHLAYLVSHLDGEWFDLTVILSSNRSENANVDIEKIKNSGARLFYYPLNRNFNISKDFFSILKLVPILKKEKFDIIHAHSSKAGGVFRVAAFFAGNKNVLYTPHCFYFQGLSGIKRKVYVVIEKLLAKITSYLIVSEGELKETIKNRIIAKKQIQNINNAIDFNEYVQNLQIEEILSEYDIPAQKFIVGAIGRLTAQKDWETFIFASKEVLRNYPETIFIITGEGELRNQIEKLIFTLGLEKNVVLTGYVKDIYKIFSILDVFVNTSLWEGLPYVLLEAMKFKKPIIATDTGNESIILHEKSGFITPVKDYKAIAQKICELIKDKQKTILMGKEGNEILTRKYSFELFIKKHQQLYKNLVYKN